MTFLRTVVRELGRAVPPIRRIHEGLHQAIAQRDEAHRGLAEERKAREAAEAMLRRFASEAGASPDSGRGTLEAELASEREARMLEQSRTLTPEEFETFARWRYLKSTDRLIAMDDFGVKPAVRFGWEKPPHPQIEAILASTSTSTAGRWKASCRCCPASSRSRAIRSRTWPSPTGSTWLSPPSTPSRSMA
jgi:hypothetical protein